VIEIVERVIVLSWIQNFLKKFIKDNEDEYAEYVIHNKQQGRSLSHKINEGGHHLDTKISYQYPKGKLSFLAKPEDPISKFEKANRQKRLELHFEEKSTEKSSSERGPQKRSPVTRSPESRTLESRSSKTYISENKNSTPPIKKKPFQLTEIPSPIYGFSRPAKQSDKVVEHELSHFLDKEFEKKLDPSILRMKQDSFSEIEIEIEQDSFSEIEIEQDSFSRVEFEEESVSGVEIEQESFTDVEMAASEIAAAAAISKVLERTDEVRVVEESVAEKVHNSSEVSSRKRSSLPFNVMMLKQDRIKWEENKRKRTIPPLVELPDKVIASPIEGKKDSNIFESKEEVQVEKIEVIQNDHSVVECDNETHDFVEALPEIEVQIEEPPAASDLNLYEFPKMNLLKPPVIVEDDTEWLLYQEELLNQTLQNFNVGASVVNVTQGPAVTRFEVQPEPGVKVNKITNLSDDIKLSLAARDIRIEAPIPGKHTIGIEVPNQKSRPVLINEIIQSTVFRESASPLTAVLGLDISGKPIVTDLKKMPHGLIAGATGSGKSVCINTILVSLLFKASPEDLKLLLIDPKMVELAPYNRIPHLVSPVITDVKAATASLKWAVDEMERRYELFAHTGVRDINRFNELAIKNKQYSDKLPFIVIIIDELADLMMMSPADVEEAICRIAQKARACGIHLIVATQRPSVDVITGLIKANIPTRVAFSVSSQVDSRTIIDISGAEKLLGRGDMLFLENGSSKPVRLQGTFVSDEEIDLVVGHVREQREPDYLFEQEELLKKAQVTEEEDELFYEACEFIIEQGLASTSSLQRRFKIGYNRAARLMDMLESNGFITSANGSKPREVLITESDLESMQDTGTIN
jgi:DNA segregation ATPase FtsK/SpoIIIE, S-DNA-T family